MNGIEKKNEITECWIDDVSCVYTLLLSLIFKMSSLGGESVIAFQSWILTQI